ncbi:MAG: DUF2779 domain-containing protein [Chloroflexota bacterium]
MGSLGPSGELTNKLIAEGKVGLFDIPLEAIRKADGSIGSTAERQRRQITQMRLNEEWVDPTLADMMQSVPYPLHFVDFETCAPTVPRYAGMRPFETIAFQWSCHTIQEPGAAVTHTDWLQEEDHLPNADFALALREQLGDEGTMLVWSDHERTVLQTIRQQLEETDSPTEGLIDWLDHLTAKGPSARILDLHKLAAKYYYHPRMGGKATVKSVCEAVWQQSEALRNRYPEFRNGTGPIQSPYRSLPPLEINDVSVAVRNGTGPSWPICT